MKKKSFRQLNDELGNGKHNFNKSFEAKTTKNNAFLTRNRRGYKQMSSKELLETLLQMKEYTSFQAIDSGTVEEVEFFQNSFEKLIKTRKGILDLLSFLLLKATDKENLEQILGSIDIRGKFDQEMMSCFQMILKLSRKVPSPLSHESIIGSIKQPDQKDMYNPSIEKIEDAFIIMKGHINQQINEGKQVSLTQVVNSFEIGLLPYYFSDGDHQHTLMNALRFFLSSITSTEQIADKEGNNIEGKTRYKDLKDWPQKKDITPLMLLEKTE